MYDPTVGRWLSADPIGFEAGDVNLYRYSINAPSVRSDPNGLASANGAGLVMVSYGDAGAQLRVTTFTWNSVMLFRSALIGHLYHQDIESDSKVYGENDKKLARLKVHIEDLRPIGLSEHHGLGEADDTIDWKYVDQWAVGYIAMPEACKITHVATGKSSVVAKADVVWKDKPEVPTGYDPKNDPAGQLVTTATEWKIGKDGQWDKLPVDVDDPGPAIDISPLGESSASFSWKQTSTLVRVSDTVWRREASLTWDFPDGIVMPIDQLDLDRKEGPELIRL